MQERGLQRDTARRRQLGQQPEQRQVNVILRRDVQRTRELQNGHVRSYSPVNDGGGARASSTGDEGSNLVRWNDGGTWIRGNIQVRPDPHRQHFGSARRRVQDVERACETHGSQTLVRSAYHTGGHDNHSLCSNRSKCS